MLREVSNSVQFAELELGVLARWQRERTFQRSALRRAGAPRFVFYDGPPFATGLPHYGHILTSFIKDVVPRYQTMRGYHVPRRWGWDCHGLPVELEAERALELRSPADIARHGVGPFNATCRALVTRYAGEWEQVMARLGRWVDFASAYRTMDDDYLESVAWCFHALHERGLVYEGEKVVAYCTRCQTALSNFETRLDDAYRPREDLAVTVKFALAPNGASNEALLAWTTTPWTLPANAALAVHLELAYTRFERDGDSVWLAAAARGRYAAELAGHAERETVPGSALVGRRYQAPLALSSGERCVVAAEWSAPTTAPASSTSRRRSGRTTRPRARRSGSPAPTRYATTARSTTARVRSPASTCSKPTSRSRRRSPAPGRCSRAHRTATSTRTAGAATRR
ncbi:MAG TPA: class I tRNA ligase family protein [Kofleriaceae bacterium]